MKNYQCVIFDWDGTLMDSTQKIVANLRRAIADLGWPTVEDHKLKNIIGLSINTGVHHLYPEGLSGHPQELTDRYLHYFHTMNHREVNLFEGAEEVLVALKAAGVQLAIATGKGRKGLDMVLSQCNYGHFFTTTRTADQTRSKPDPLMLEEILAELALSPDDAIMVGDTSYDLEMAKRIQMPAVGVSYGAHNRSQLENCQPIAIIDHIKQLLPIVLSSDA